MRRFLLCAVLALPIAVACKAALDTLEKATSENSVEGKLIRGANRLRKSFQDLDPSEEHFIGRSVAAQILALPEYPLSETVENQLAYVEQVGHGLVETNDAVRRPFLDYRFGILHSDEINAFACPGGTILVTTGLLRMAEDEDELAAVLAHEIAHVTLRHGVAAIQQANLTSAFEYLGTGAAQATMDPDKLAKLTDVFDDSVGDIVKTMVTSGYSREAEFAADRLGREFLRTTGYDPQALERVLGRMHGAGGMLATHPAPEERIAALGAPLAFAVEEEGLSVRDARHHKHFGPLAR